jgi:CHAD domain-containing protein
MQKSAFERKFRQDAILVNKRLKVFIDDSDDEKNIHDVRVSIRRLDATFSLLPKKVRRRYSDRIEKYIEFLNANSNARDYDIIAARLVELGASGLAELQNKKKAEIARAAMLARALKKIPTRLASAVDDKRVNKIARRLIGRIKEMLPAVVSDGTRVEELHRLRRNLRKLRYILDVVPPNRRSKYIKTLQRATGIDVPLRELQDILGSIHDCDITIEYLNCRPDARHLLNRETRSRKLLYQKFVRHMRR